jgi:hypothetical protein
VDFPGDGGSKTDCAEDFSGSDEMDSGWLWMPLWRKMRKQSQSRRAVRDENAELPSQTVALPCSQLQQTTPRNILKAAADRFQDDLVT